MAEPEVSRRLAVFVHADVVDSTALVRGDETLAHTRINAAFRVLSSTVTDYGGTVHEVRGDALIAEFPRASDALCAVLRFQRENAERNREFDDAVVPVVRVGVSLGEAVFADGTVTGAGIVLAQRVEQLADPGGVCVTGAVREALPERLPFRQEDLGERKVKGFDDAVHVYRVGLEDGARVPLPERQAKARTGPTRWKIAAALALAAVIVGTVLASWRWFAEPAAQATAEARVADDADLQVSIAVLPFTNLSKDAAQEYFSDGITEDLITELSKLAGLFVIARNSTFAYKGQAVDVKQVAQALGVRYVLEGSVRRAGERVRINAQLIDGGTGGHLWAERYDGILDDVFALQDRVTRRIVAALEVELTPREQRLTAADSTHSVAAYDTFLQGLALQSRKTPEGSFQALSLFSKAIEIDPAYHRARAAMAQIYWDHHLDTKFNMLLGQPSANTMIDQNNFTSWELLEQVGDAPLSQARALRSRMLLLQRRFDEAMREAQAAVDLGPSEPGAHDVLIENLAFAGRVEEVLRHIDRSIDLDPSLPGEKLFLRGLAHYTAGRLEQSLAALERARTHNPGQRRYLVIQAAALAELGRLDEARQVFAEYEAWLSTFATENWIRYQWPFRDREVSQRLITSLVKVGVTPALQSIDVSATDRLRTKQLRSLLANTRIVGADHGPFGAEDEFEITRDGDAQIVSQDFLTYFDPGEVKTVIRDDLLCDPWWDLGLYCVAVFRNPSGSHEQRNEYAFFTLSGPFTFSVTGPAH